MKISELIKELEHELKTNGELPVIFDFDIKGTYFKEFYIDEKQLQIPAKAQLYFNNDFKDFYIQNFLALLVLQEYFHKSICL